MNWSPKIRAVINHARCFAAGFRDGWQQPQDLTFTTNIEWLLGEHMYDVPDSVVGYSDRWQNTLDRGVSLGQRVRRPSLRGILRRLRNAGRRTCGYCGYGWTHRSTCPLTGRIDKVGEGWQS